MTGFGFNFEIGSISSPTAYQRTSQSHVLNAKTTIENLQTDRWEMTHNLPVTPRGHDVVDDVLVPSTLVHILSRDVGTAISWSTGPLTFDTFWFLSKPPFPVGTCEASWHSPWCLIETFERHEWVNFFVDISLQTIFSQFVWYDISQVVWHHIDKWCRRISYRSKMEFWYGPTSGNPWCFHTSKNIFLGVCDWGWVWVYIQMLWWRWVIM